jgi:hypothetical protein
MREEQVPYHKIFVVFILMDPASLSCRCHYPLHILLLFSQKIFLDEKLCVKFLTFFTDTAEIWTEVAEKASWDPANRGQKLHLVWKISQIIIDYLCVRCSPFFTLWPYPTLDWCVCGGGGEMGGGGVLMRCCWRSARQAVGTDTPVKLH